MSFLLNRISKTDPTRTAGIRRRWIAELKRRFTRLKNDIYTSIVVQDCFGLKESNHLLRAATATAERQFAYPRTDRKIKEFMSWLQEQEAKDILEVRRGVSLAGMEESWNDVYIDSAYQQGIRRARAELGKAGAAIPDVDDPYGGVRAAFNQPVHAERVGALYTRVFSELEGITKAMDQQISRELAQGLIEGKNPRQIARTLNDRVEKIGLTRAKTMARTEVIRAHHQATVVEYTNYEIEGVSVKAEWLTAGYNVCEICEGMEGKVFTIKEIEPMIPAHPNCLIESSRVSAKGITATSKRWYDGEVVIITTSGGKNLTCTPNHPILTRTGWVPAGFLDIGSDVICSVLSNLDSAESCDNKNTPATIKEVTEAFRRSSKVSSKKVKVASPDFHGDGEGSDIAIINSDRFLLNEINATFFEHSTKHNFLFRYMGFFYFFCLGSFAKIIKGTLPSFHGIVGRSNLVFSLFLRHLRPSELFSFTLCPQGNFHEFEVAINNIPINPILFRQGEYARSINIKLGNLFGIKRNGSRSGRSKSSLNDNPFNDFVGDSELPGDIANGSTRPIFFDNVIRLRRKFFSGHVYNLQTEKGYYEAEGIVVHNCRCVAIPQIGEKVKSKKTARTTKAATTAKTSKILTEKKTKKASLATTFSIAKTAKDVDRFIKARDNIPNKYKPFITPLTAKQYRERGANLYLSKDGQTGYALTPEGDLGSVFSTNENGKKAVAHAIRQGAKTLDCYDGFLPGYYKRFGFREYKRDVWDELYAHPEWDYGEFGRPDVVYMRLKNKKKKG